MKCVYKIGRLYIVSPELFKCFDPFLVPDLQYDETSDFFYDSQGNPQQRPASFHKGQNVLSLDFALIEPDLTGGKIISTERDMTVWRVNDDWVYSCNYGKGWLKISSDYLHATYCHGYPDADGSTTTYTQLIRTAVECSLLIQGYLIVHAACIELENKAILFSAMSGVGKSTRANLWVEAYGASFISGDRPIIDPIRGKALGAPWDGKESIYRNIEVPIAAFNCIQRSEITRFTHMSDNEKKSFLATQTFIPMWDPMLVSKVFAAIRQMIMHVTIWNLACDRTIEAAHECHDIIFPHEPQNIAELLRYLHATDTPKAEYRTAIDQFMEFKARKLGIPFYGSFELTPLCNLDCKMCYVHLHKQQMGNLNLMSTEQWESIMDDACSAGMKLARLTGGECLTYPGFEELYLYLQRKGVDITVLTNGLLLNDKKIEFFRTHPPKLIQVTLYGSNDDAYEKVTGVRCFHQVYQNIMHARDAGLPIIVAITPNAFAHDDLPDILRLVEKAGIKYHINSILEKPRRNTGRELHDLTSEQYLELFRQHAQLLSRQLLQTDPAEIQEPSTGDKADIGIKCGAGRSNFTITWDGRMVPCLGLSDFHSAPPGKCFSESWKDINNWANNLQMPSECGSCVYQPNCIQCIAIHYDSTRPGHCNKEICKRTKMFAEAGLINI